MDEDAKKIWILDAIKGLGLPTVFLGVVLYMIWVAGSWAGAEVVMPLFKKQMAFIDKASEITENMSKAISKIEQTLEDHSDDNKMVIIEINKSSDELSKSHEEIQSVITSQSGILQKIANDAEVNAKNNSEQTAVLKKIEQNTSRQPGTL